MDQGLLFQEERMKYSWTERLSRGRGSKRLKEEAEADQEGCKRE